MKKRFIFTLLMIVALCFIVSVAFAIKPYSANPFYWQYKGEPLLLVGGSDTDHLFLWPDLLSHLNDIQSFGGNYVRNTMSDRKTPDVKPYIKTSGKYDLDQWSSTYWNKFKDLLNWTRDRDIIVQIEVWDRFDYSQDSWIGSPWRPANNVNYSESESGFADSYPDHPNDNKQPFFYTVPALQNNTLILNYQKAFVDKMLSYSLSYDNVLYCMDNETSGDRRWGEYWANYIKNKAQALGKEAHTTEMWDKWDISHSMHANTYNHPEYYTFSDVSQNTHNYDEDHWNKLIWYRDKIKSLHPWPINNSKIYGGPEVDNHDKYGNLAQGVERFWRNIIGGCASSRFHRLYCGVTPEQRAAVKAANKFATLINLWDLEPHMELLEDRGTDEAYLACDPGNAYALYFTKGGSVRLNLINYSGSFLIKWVNISTGEFGSESTVDGGAKITINAPGSGGWVAAITTTGPTPCSDIEGYTLCASEGEAVNFTETVDVAYGANCSYNFMYGVSGNINFNNSTFGDPIPGVEKRGYYSNETGPTPDPIGKLTGTFFDNIDPIGGNDADNGVNGSLSTYVDDNNESGGYFGYDLGVNKQITSVKYSPRNDNHWAARRMNGGKFQGSTTSSSSGYTTFYTISGSPAYDVLTTKIVSGTYRYVRYLCPTGSHCNVSEIEFYGSGSEPKPKPTPNQPPSEPKGFIIKNKFP